MISIRKFSKRIFALVYCFFAIFWSFVLGRAVVYETSAIGASGIHYFSRFNILSFFALFCALSLLVSCVLVTITAFKNKPKSTLDIVIILLLCINAIILYLIPPQVYAVSFFSIFRFVIHIPSNYLSNISFVFSVHFFFIISVVYIMILALNLKVTKQ